MRKSTVYHIMGAVLFITAPVVFISFAHAISPPVGILRYADIERFSNNLKADDFGVVYRLNEKSELHPEQQCDVTDWCYSLGAPVLSSLRIANVDDDGISDIICTSYGPQPNPYSSGQIVVLDINGTPLPGWPVITGGPIPATAAIGDIDNDGNQEIVVGDWYNMYIYNHDGTPLTGWPIGNGINYSPALEDLDGDGDLEVIYSSGNHLYIRYHNGGLYPGWPVSAPDNIGSPAIGDIDDDGEMEIVAGTLAGPVGPDPFEVYIWKLDGSVLPGFPVATSGVVKSTPAIGDIENDGFSEIVLAAYDTSNNDYIYCWDKDGNIKPGWPVQARYCRLSSPALGDVDGDGDLEIFIGGLQTYPVFVEILYAFHHDGQPLENWPVELPHEGGVSNINSSPVIAEVDGDSVSPEIFVKTYDYIFALNADGTMLDDFPFYLSDESQTGTHSPSPAISDLDNDGDADYVFGSSSGTVAFVDCEGVYDSELSFWPMYKHDQYGSGRLVEEGQGFCEYVPGDINGDGNVMGNDVTYGVRYFKGLGGQPPDSCWNDSTSSWLYSAGDANGNCQFTGSDVTFLVAYFKSYNPEILWCPQTPPL